jgi:hypothetical protein
VAWFELKQRLEFLIQTKPRLYFFNSVLIQGKGTIEVQKWLVTLGVLQHLSAMMLVLYEESVLLCLWKRHTLHEH